MYSSPSSIRRRMDFSPMCTNVHSMRTPVHSLSLPILQHRGPAWELPACSVSCEPMRMVFSGADEDVFYPAQERLAAAVGRWARKHRRDVDPFVVGALVEHRWADGDGILGR